MNKIVGHNVLLYYPNFIEMFIILTNTIKEQLRGSISQNGNPTNFYSRKLTPAQNNHTTTEQ